MRRSDDGPEGQKPESKDLLRASRTRTERVPTSRLRPNPRNARQHSKRQIRKIADSYRAFGVINPIVVGPDLQILAGHGRFEAAKLIGVSELDVVVVEDLTPHELSAYALADNKLSDLSSFDLGIVLETVETIMLEDPTMDLTVTGFETAEIDGMVGATRTAEFNDLDDELHALPAVDPVTRVDDVWLLGGNRIVCGDSTDSATIDRLVGDLRVRLMLSDVPYNLEIEGVASGLGRTQHRDFAMAAGEMSYDQFVDFLRRSIAACKSRLIDGALVLLFIDWRHVGEMLAAGRASDLELKNILVWGKDNAGMGSLWRSQHELIVAFKNGQAPHVNNVALGVHGRYRSNVLQYPGMNSMAKGRAKALELHATVKPVALIADLILDVTDRGDIVLDPFGGSGTAIIAAEKTGRRAFLSEFDPGFVDVSVMRWEALTGQSARLEATNQTFAEVRAERMELGS